MSRSAHRWQVDAVLAVVASCILLGAVAPSASATNNVGVWWNGDATAPTTNYGGDDAFNTPSVTAATGEIVLNRTAEQSSETSSTSGIFQAGTYASGKGTHLDLCSSTLAGEQQVFSEYRDSGKGHSFNCGLYGTANPFQVCVFNLGLSSAGEWYAAGGCPGEPNLINLTLNWGTGYSYVGGELNNGKSTPANKSSSSAEYEPGSTKYRVWNGPNRTSPEEWQYIYCGEPSKKWYQGTEVEEESLGVISHPSNTAYCQ